MNTIIEHNGKHYELTGEYRSPLWGEWFLFCGEPEQFTAPGWTKDGGEISAKPILREVEKPTPFPVTYDPAYGEERSAICPLTVKIDYDGDIGIGTEILSPENAIDLARRILDHFGVVD